MTRRCRIVVFGGDLGGEEETGVVYVGPKDCDVKKLAACYSYHCRTMPEQLQSRALGGDPGYQGRSNVSEAPSNLDIEASRFFQQMVTFHLFLASELPKHAQRYRGVALFQSDPESLDPPGFDSAFGGASSANRTEKLSVRLECTDDLRWTACRWTGLWNRDLVSGRHVNSDVGTDASNFADDIPPGDVVEAAECPVEVVPDGQIYALSPRRNGIVAAFLKGRAFLQGEQVFLRAEDMPCDILLASPSNSVSEPLRLQISLCDEQLRLQITRFSKDTRVLVTNHLHLRV